MVIKLKTGLNEKLMHGNEKDKFSGGFCVLTPVEKMDTLLYGVKYTEIL